MVTTHISTFVTAGFYWTSNVVSNKYPSVCSVLIQHYVRVVK